MPRRGSTSTFGRFRFLFRFPRPPFHPDAQARLVGRERRNRRGDGGYRFGSGLTPPKSNLAAEHISNYETLRDSTLRWTLMCPVWLKEEIPPGHARFAPPAPRRAPMKTTSMASTST